MQDSMNLFFGFRGIIEWIWFSRIFFTIIPIIRLLLKKKPTKSWKSLENFTKKPVRTKLIWKVPLKIWKSWKKKPQLLQRLWKTLCINYQSMEQKLVIFKNLPESLEIIIFYIMWYFFIGWCQKSGMYFDGKCQNIKSE